MAKRTLRDLPDAAVRGKRVLVRVDFNVPVSGSGGVTDDTRIRATLPTLEHLTGRGARVILVSHHGRPGGEWRDELSLQAAADRLGELLQSPVTFVSDIVGAEARAAVDGLAAGEVVVLENIRFLPGEETNDPKLSEELAARADVYVNDAFGTAHRAHASTFGVPEYMKREGRPAVAGLLMERELRFLGEALESPERPFIAILGGAKISGKIDVMENLLPRVDRLLIGGAMANTFFRALGLETGESLVEEDRVEMARELLDRAEEKISLPVDCVVAPGADSDVPARVVDRDAIPEALSVLDIGPTSVATFRDSIERARTIFWNGPMGLFEVEAFSHGSVGVARAVADAADAGALAIIGGGDTVSAVREAGAAERMTHVSTGGGASLEFLEGRPLPGVAILQDSD